MRHRQKSRDARDDGDLRNFKHLSRHFNLPGLEELIQSLTIPTPRPMPEPGVVIPLHSSQTPSKVNFDALHYLLQLNQCRALTLGVEWFRSRQPTCMGTLYWQLNDCWPGVTSWSAIDGDGKPKPLWFATRRFFADYLPTIQPEADGSLSVYFINDSDSELTVSNIPVTRYTFERDPIATQRIDCRVPPRTVHRVPIDPTVAMPGDPTHELIWFGDEYGAIWFFKPDKELKYPAPKFDAELLRVGEEWSLRITAQTLLRDVCINVDRLDPEASIDDQMVTVFPGAGVTFLIRSDRLLKKEQLITPPVFQCANRFGAALIPSPGSPGEG
jgi:beta-mannosidase